MVFGKSEESRPPFKIENYLFSKNQSKCLKMAISYKKSSYSLLMGFRGKIAVLRNLEGFLEKVKKVEPL